MMMRRVGFSSLALAMFVAVLGIGTPFAIAAVPNGQTVDGIHCDAAEGVTMHIHAHVAVFDHGKPVIVPEDIGRPLAAQCFYWLHTHTPDGIIHIESPAVRTFTLGQFFDVWGVPLTRANVAGATPRGGERVKIFVDGRPYTGDPRAIELAVHLDVAILVGPPYRVPAPFTAWNGQ